MEIGILHLHVTTIILFMVLFTFKTFLLLSNKRKFLNKVRGKTKIFDIVLGTLILVTGIYLLALREHIEFYLIAKFALMIAAIPLGIIGVKRENKILATLSLLMFIYSYAIAETRSVKFKRSHLNLTYDESLPVEEQGKAIYNVLCIDCHGSDGKKGLFKASDLSMSELSLQERKEIISNGKGIMPNYKNDLNQEEIDKVLKFLETLK